MRKEIVEMDFLVELKKITRENIDEVLALKVSAEQDNTAFPFAIYIQNTIVGFAKTGETTDTALEMKLIISEKMTK